MFSTVRTLVVLFMRAPLQKEANLLELGSQPFWLERLRYEKMYKLSGTNSEQTEDVLVFVPGPYCKTIADFAVVSSYHKRL